MKPLLVQKYETY